MCRSYCGRSLTIFHRVTDGNCQGATTVAGLPFISPQDQTVVVEVASIPANASFASTTSIVCGASIQQSASVSQFVPWMFVEGLQQAKNARSARCDACLSAGVYEFSSPAVKPGHGFMISSLTLEFEYLVGGCPQDRKRQYGDWYRRHRGTQPNSGRQPHRFCVWWARLQLRFRRAQRHRTCR